MRTDHERHTDRENILREVYEENKRIDDGSFRYRSYASRSIVTRVGGVIALVAIVALALNTVFKESESHDSRAVSGSSQNNPDASRSVPAVPTEPLLDDGDIPDAREYEAIGDGAVPLADLFDLRVHTIVIDPGHGGLDSGARGSAGSREKDITLDVARRLRRRLIEGYGYRIEMTRDRDSTLSLRQRAEFANGLGADLVVSIHVNYFPSEPVYALETYYYGPQTDDSSLRLAELENRHSDYAVAEFRELTQRMVDRVKLQESRRLALYVQRSLFRNSRELNEEVSDWGVKTAPFTVLVASQAPGILTEIGVISNREEEARFKTAEYREQLAMFLEEGIVNYLNDLSNQEASSKGDPENASKETAND